MFHWTNGLGLMAPLLVTLIATFSSASLGPYMVLPSWIFESICCGQWLSCTKAYTQGCFGSSTSRTHGLVTRPWALNWDYSCVQFYIASSLESRANFSAKMTQKSIFLPAHWPLTFSWSLHDLSTMPDELDKILQWSCEHIDDHWGGSWHGPQQGTLSRLCSDSAWTTVRVEQTGMRHLHHSQWEIQLFSSERCSERSVAWQFDVFNHLLAKTWLWLKIRGVAPNVRVQTWLLFWACCCLQSRQRRSAIGQSLQRGIFCQMGCFKPSAKIPLSTCSL